MKSTLLPLEPFQVFNSILEMGGKETISHAYFLSVVFCNCTYITPFPLQLKWMLISVHMK
jgi:hypothetical protein